METGHSEAALKHLVEARKAAPEQTRYHPEARESAEKPRTHIPSLCWVARPGDVRRCTEHEEHDGDHYHAYSRTFWPRRAGETQ
ncbi:hypothetical protein [Streptomyces sp. NPDC087525]|uniref:hypothetical protein n=1 Tax=Streptomyces sp. NPDC087525 TaxID=3365793 RepID=UPI003815938C